MQEVEFLPPINLAAKQMCQEAISLCGRIPEHVASVVVETLVKAGHCYCLECKVGDTPHHECCKCADRYAVRA